MQTIKDVVNAIQQGKLLVVTFKGGIEDKESYAEKGMRARLVAARQTSGDDVVQITCDLGEFEAHNLPLESANYFDSRGGGTKTAREAGQYKPKEDLYFDLDERVCDLMEIEGDASIALLNRYTEADSGLTYVQWLEHRIVELEAAIVS